MADNEEPPLKRRKGKEPLPSEPLKTLNLELFSASSVRQRLAILHDSDLNPHDLATVEYSLKRGLIFTVRNDETSVSAMLFLDEFLEDTSFCTRGYSKQPHYIKLHQILKFLNGATDDHTFTVSQFDGFPDELHFMIGTPDGSGSSKQLKVNLTKSNLDSFSKIRPICSFLITPNALTEIIDQLKKANHQSVLVEVKRDVVKISTVGNSNQGTSWRLPRDKDIPAGANHRALFRLPHLKPVRTASSMAEVAYIFLLAKPSDNTLVHVKFKDFGHVSFFYIAQDLKSEPNEDAPDDDAPDGDAPEAAQPANNDAAGEASEAAEASQPGGDAAEASQPGSDAAEALETGGEEIDAGGEVIDALQPGGDVAEASQPGSDAAEASQLADDAAEV